MNNANTCIRIEPWLSLRSLKVKMLASAMHLN